MKFDWTYDEKSFTWVTGTNESGCGVYQDEESHKWNVNIVYEGDLTILGKEFDSREEAMDAAVVEWMRIHDSFNHN